MGTGGAAVKFDVSVYDKTGTNRIYYNSNGGNFPTIADLLADSTLVSLGVTALSSTVGGEPLPLDTAVDYNNYRFYVVELEPTYKKRPTKFNLSRKKSTVTLWTYEELTANGEVGNSYVNILAELNSNPEAYYNKLNSEGHLGTYSYNGNSYSNMISNSTGTEYRRYSTSTGNVGGLYYNGTQWSWVRMSSASGGAIQ